MHTQFLAKTALAALAAMALAMPVVAQVNLPNGGVSENVVDLRVKTVGGLVTVDRQFEEGRWQINLRWAPAVLSGEVVGSVSCKAYPELKIQGQSYTGDGLSWLRENRYSARVTGYFDGSDCPANRLKTIRWQDRNTGHWMDYERASAGDLQLKLVRYGNRNAVATQLIYDPQGKLQSVKDHHGNTVLQYLYTGEQLTEIRDNPGLIPGNTAAARAVKYAYTNVTNAQGVSYPTLSQVTDVLGNVTRYTYTGTYLATLTDPEGRLRRYDYTADRVTKYTDADGKVTSYVYDYDKLKKEFYARTTYPATAAGSRIVEQWYDLDGRVVRRDVNGQSEYRKGPTDTAARSETRTDGAGRQTVTTQDEYGNTLKTVYPDGSTTSAQYSAVHGQVTEETDELGIKIRYDYDSQGNLIKKTEAVGMPEQRITDYEVNSLGLLTKETRKGQIGAPGASGQDASVSYVYDNRGNRSEVTDPQGKVSRYTYDLMGNVTQMTDAASRVWKAEYDAAGHLTARIDPLNQRSEATYDKAGNRIKSTDALGHIVRFTVNGQNRVTQTTNPLGGIRQTAYDESGRVIADINEAGQTVARSTYDAQGQLLSTQDAAGNTTRYSYDPSQTPFAPVSIQFAGVTRNMRYDSRDRVIEQSESWRETDANGQEQARSATSKSVYNLKGQQIESLDRLGNKTQMAYDALGRLKSVTDAQGGVTQFTYDARDNLLALTDANGNTTRFEYDANNRKTKETRPLGQSTTYTYDAVGQLTEVVDAQGNKQRYTHDSAGRASKEEHLNAAGSVTRTITTSYNAIGTLTGIADSNAGHADHQSWQSKITVDALQRKTKEDITLGSQTVTFTTTYSSTGKKASQTLADGTVVTYAHDQSGGEGNKGTDELTAIELPGTGTISIGNRNWGQPGQITYPGGSQRQNDYDPLLRLKQIQLKTAGQQTLLHRQYSFDAESNITGQQTEYGDTAYGYDSLYRLTQVTPNITSGPGLPNERYTYDKLGNRLTDNNRGGSNAWQYDGNNQLTKSYNGDNQAVTPSYDANGSLTQKSTNASDPYNNQKYVYDAGNRLTEVQDPNGNPIASYQYDPLGRRIRKTECRGLNGSAWLALAAPRTTTFYYTDEGLAAEYQQSGSAEVALKTQYGWEPNGTWGTRPQFLKTARSGQTTPEYFYAQNDHLGTPQQLIDQAGNLVWAQRAEAFGKTNVALDTVTNNLRFPGQYYDPETNTHYNYFRDYEPNIGRYVQKDPIGLGGGFNIYSYTWESPQKFIDPSGLECWWVDLGNAEDCRQTGLRRQKPTETYETMQWHPAPDPSSPSIGLPPMSSPPTPGLKIVWRSIYHEKGYWEEELDCKVFALFVCEDDCGKITKLPGNKPLGKKWGRDSSAGGYDEITGYGKWSNSSPPSGPWDLETGPGGKPPKPLPGPRPRYR